MALQRSLHAEVARGERGDTWVVIEHDPVITLGRNARATSVLLSTTQLTAQKIDVVEIERGGDATYHGPGQLVVYPIVRLERFREVAPMVTAIETAVAAMLATYGIVARMRPEHRGVYVGDAAICAVGLAVRQMTSLHGLALNISTALDYDSLIVPCGLPGFGITSMEAELERPVDFSAAADALIAALARAFAVRIETDSASAALKA